MKFWTREEYHIAKQTILADKGKSHCPFCHIKNNEDSELIEWEWRCWLIVHAKFPYGMRNDHLLVVPKRCVEFTKDINSQEMSEFPEIEKFMTNFYKSHEDYWSMIRQRSHAKSVNHLHYHYLPGEICESDVLKMFERQKIRSNI